LTPPPCVGFHALTSAPFSCSRAPRNCLSSRSLPEICVPLSPRVLGSGVGREIWESSSLSSSPPSVGRRTRAVLATLLLEQTGPPPCGLSTGPRSAAPGVGPLEAPGGLPGAAGPGPGPGAAAARARQDPWEDLWEARTARRRCLAALAAVVRNVRRAPQVGGYRRLRRSNPALAQEVFAFPAAVEALRLAGFVEVQDRAGDAGDDGEEGGGGSCLWLEVADPDLLARLDREVGHALGCLDAAAAHF